MQDSPGFNEFLNVVLVNKYQKQPLEVFYKKGILKISQNSQENTCVGVP